MNKKLSQYLNEAKSNLDKMGDKAVKTLSRHKIRFGIHSLGNSSTSGATVKVLAYLGNIEVGSMIVRDYGQTQYGGTMPLGFSESKGIFEIDEIYEMVRKSFGDK